MKILKFKESEKGKIMNESYTITKASEEAYEDLVYPSKPFYNSHIGHLEAAARIYGLTPPSATTARVLEIGCSFGGNIVTQALYYPKAQFKGIDLSVSQIEKGKEIINAMELTNIELEQKNILDIDKDFGVFDYIIVHGIYSWVPDVVKDKILEICHNNLSPKGIALISYNTYPGWKDRGTLRDIFFYANTYTNELPLLDKVQRGKAILNKLVDCMRTVPTLTNKFGNIIAATDELSQHQDYYLGHEYLEPVNDPVYLHEFVSRLNDHNLSYVGNAALSLSFIGAHNDEIAKTVRELAPDDHIVQEQCLDFLLNSTFRQTILCHSSESPNIDRTENFDKKVLESLSYEVRKLDEFLNLCKNSPIIEESFREAFNSTTYITVSDVMERLEKKVKESDSEEQLNSLKNDVYRAFAIGMVHGHFVFTVAMPPLLSYTEGETYIPERFCRYIQVLQDPQYKPYIMVGSRINEFVTTIDEVYAVIMPFFTKDATRKEIIEKIAELKPYRVLLDGTQENLEPEELFNKIVNTCQFMGYFQK